MSTLCEIECNDYRICKKLKWPQLWKFHLNSTTCTSFMKTKACSCARGCQLLKNQRPVDHNGATGDRSSLFEIFTWHKWRTISHFTNTWRPKLFQISIHNHQHCGLWYIWCYNCTESRIIWNYLNWERLTWNFTTCRSFTKLIKACLGVPWSSGLPKP